MAEAQEPSNVQVTLPENTPNTNQPAIGDLQDATVAVPEAVQPPIDPQTQVGYMFCYTHAIVAYLNGTIL